MKQYLDLLEYVLKNGEIRIDRTGTGTKSIFGYQMRFDLQQGFPLITTKKVHFKSIVHELIWFLKGDTNIKYLKDNGVSIWDEWSDQNGDLGPVYGHQWRKFGEHHIKSSSNVKREGIDQISDVITQIKNNPNSRRLIVSAWNPVDIPSMALPPCHTMFQFYVSTDNKLSCQLYQRSADLFLGMPYNIASYALLTHMIAHVCELEVGEFIHTVGDAHLYLNHVDQANLQLTRESLPLPKIILNPNIKSIFDFQYSDITLENYISHPAIKAPVSI